jgi:hypothetical protein
VVHRQTSRRNRVWVGRYRPAFHTYSGKARQHAISEANNPQVILSHKIEGNDRLSLRSVYASVVTALPRPVLAGPLNQHRSHHEE